MSAGGELEAAKTWLVREMKAGKAVVRWDSYWNENDFETDYSLDGDDLVGYFLEAFWSLYRDGVIVESGHNIYKLKEVTP